MAVFFWPLMILLAALALVVLELLLPSGGVLGVLAALAYGAAIVSGYMQGGLHAGTLFMLAALLVLPVLGYALVRWWPHTAWGRRVIMHPPDEEMVLPASRLQAADWVGRQGVTLAPLLPGGAVRIEGRILDAASEQGSIEKGALVRVVAIRDNRLVVRCEALPGDWQAGDEVPGGRRDERTDENAAKTLLPDTTLSPGDKSAGTPGSDGGPQVDADRPAGSHRRPDIDLDIPEGFDERLT